MLVSKYKASRQVVSSLSGWVLEGTSQTVA